MKYILCFVTFVCLNTCRREFEGDKKINSIIVRHINIFLSSEPMEPVSLKKKLIIAFFDIGSSSIDTNVVYFGPMITKKEIIPIFNKYYVPTYFEKISPTTGVLIIERKSPFFDKKEDSVLFEKIINDYIDEPVDYSEYISAQKLFIYEGKVVKVEACLLEDDPLEEIFEKYVQTTNPMPTIHN